MSMRTVLINSRSFEDTKGATGLALVDSRLRKLRTGSWYVAFIVVLHWNRTSELNIYHENGASPQSSTASL
jgi:hypothetical protein